MIRCSCGNMMSDLAVVVIAGMFVVILWYAFTQGD